MRFFRKEQSLNDKIHAMLKLYGYKRIFQEITACMIEDHLQDSTTFTYLRKALNSKGEVGLRTRKDKNEGGEV